MSLFLGGDLNHWSLIALLIVLSGTITFAAIVFWLRQNALDSIFSSKLMVMEGDILEFDRRVSAMLEEVEPMTTRASERSFQRG